jgi:hypothetical protein
MFPLVSVTIPTQFGFFLIMVLSFIIGISNAITQSTSFGLGNFFPIECISWITTGTGISGLVLNFARIIALLIFGSDERKGTFLYFSIAALIILI